MEVRFTLHHTLPSARPITPQKVLLVEDDAISTEILSILLSQDGHYVMHAADGAAALSLLTSRNLGTSPDVLLIDMHMPGISGYELARKVRALPGPKPLLLAMSATSVRAGRLHAFDGFLLKPLAIDDLRRALQPSAAGSPSNGSRSIGSQSARSSLHRKKRGTLSPSSAAPERKSEPTRRGTVDGAVVAKLAKAMPAHSLRELFEACLADSRQRVEAIRESAKGGRIEETRRSAHQIKGASSMIGASGLARLAAAIELGSCKEEDTLRILDDLLDECDALERMLLAGNLTE